MSDFSAIFEFLGKVVYHIFDTTINIACGGFLLGSLVVPWRWAEIWKYVSKNRFDWKVVCLFSFFESILDIVGLCLILFGCLSPLRWKSVIVLLARKLICPLRGDQDFIEERLQCLLMLPVVLCDMFCIPIGCLTIMNPFGRQIVLLNIVTAESSSSTQSWFGNTYEVKDLFKLKTSKYLLEYGAQTLLDIGVFILSIFCAAVPTTWPGLYKGLRYQWQHAPPQLCTMLRSRAAQKSYDYEWNSWFEVVREHLFFMFYHALVDFAVAPFLLFAAIAPYRNRQLMDAFSKSKLFHERLANESNPSVPEVDIVEIPDENGLVSVVSIPRQPVSPPSIFIGSKVPGDFHYEYDYELRQNIFYIGALGLSDMLLLPMFLPLFITQYRYRSIKNHLFDESNTWGHKQLFLISSQFFLLIADVFCLWWSIPLLLITVVRSPRLKQKLTMQDVFLKHNAELYFTVMELLFYLLLDLLFLPGFLLLLLSHRHSQILSIFLHKSTMEDGCRFHSFVFWNVILVIHDLFLLLPAMILLAAIAPHRIPLVINKLLFSSFSPQHSPGGCELPYHEIKHDQDRRFDHDWDRRITCWVQLFSGILDFPFFFLAIFIIGTFWRTANFFNRVRKLKLYDSYSNPLEISNVEKSYYYKEFWKWYVRVIDELSNNIRGIVLEEFCFFWVDFFCLIPMVVVIVSLYRLVELFSGFLNALSAAPMKTEPLYDVVGSSICFPSGGEPTIKVFLKPATNVSTIVPSLVEESSKFSNFQLFVLGESMWKNTAAIFGGFLTGLAKSFLPLLLEKDKSIGWNVASPPVLDFRLNSNEIAATSGVEATNSSEIIQSDVVSEESVVVGVDIENGCESNDDNRVVLEPSAPPSQPQVVSISHNIDRGTCLWLNLPLKGTKKSTVLKKLNKFDGSVPMIWQMECVVNCERVVLFRYVETMKNVVLALEKENEILPVVCQNTTATSLIGEKTSFTDEFHVVVLKVFFEVCLDFIHLILFLLVIINPRRFYKLLCCMLEAKSKTDMRLMEKILFSLEQAELHLRQYRAGLVPVLNNICKIDYNVRLRHQYGSSIWSMNKVLAEVNSDYDFGRYKTLMKSIKRDIDLLDLASDRFSIVTQTIFDRHDKVMEFWFLKFAVWFFGYFDDSRFRSNFDSIGRHQMELSSLIFADEHDIEAKRLVAAKCELLNIYSDEHHRVKEKKSKIPGFLKRSTDKNRSLIRAHFRSMITDFFGLGMVLLLIFTLIRLIPTIRDIVHNLRSSTPITFRSIVVKQIRQLRSDGYYLCLSIFYISLLLVTVVGVPPFLADLPQHFQSLRSVAGCAKKHLREFFKNLCRLLSLITVFRTYRMIVKAALYCVLLPGAFVGDCLKIFCISQESTRFLIGSGIYFAILIACIVETIHLNYSSDSLTGLYFADSANNTILAISATICVVVAILSMLNLSSIRKFDVAEADLKRLDFSWSHLIALSVGPLDCLQLSAVIMYFFWNPVTVSQGSVSSGYLHASNLNLGGDSLSKIMFWESQDASHGSTYRTAMTIATILILFWATLIALPIAQSGRDSSVQKQIKMLKIRNAASYDALYSLLAHVLSVWIVVTLMRSWSCYVDVGGEAVLTTSSVTSCGGGSHFWAGLVAFPFLSYYTITSALVYANSATTIPSDDSHLEIVSFVRYGPTYLVGIKFVQFFVCAACMGAFSTAPAIAILLPIVIVCCLGIGYSTILTHLSDERVCNVPSVLPFRNAGFVGTAWTAIVCLIRSFAYSPNSMQNTTIFASEGVIYVGWGVIFIGALCHAYWIEFNLRQEWEKLLLAEGLNEALEKLLETFDLALIESDQQKNFLIKSDGLLNEYKAKIACARSVQDMSALVLQLEHLIMVGKLSDDFLYQRKDWIDNLLSAHLIQYPKSHTAANDGANRQMASLTESFHAEDFESQIDNRQAVPTERFHAGDVESRIDNRQVVLTSRFHALLDNISILQLGYRTQAASSSLSRDVLSILLSNHLPRDVCWVIFEYLIHTVDLRKVFLQSNPQNSYVVPPKLLKSKSKSYIFELTQFGNSFLDSKFLILAKHLTDKQK
jgi:hypothetical protein